MLTGSLVAIATPMHEGGALDLPALGKLDRFPRRQRHGRHRHRRHDRRVADGRRRRALPADQDGGRARRAAACPVIAGTGANSTAEAIELTAYAQDGRRRQAACRSSPTTTSRRRKACTGISARSRRRSTCRCCCTTCPAARSPISPTTPTLRLAAGAGHRRHQGRDRRPRPRQRAHQGAAPPASALRRATAATTSPRCRYMLLGGARRDLGHRQRRAGADGARCARAALAGDLGTRARTQRAPAAAAHASCSSRPTRSRSSGRSPRWA